jgi:hypothetical protein
MTAMAALPTVLEREDVTGATPVRDPAAAPPARLDSDPAPARAANAASGWVLPISIVTIGSFMALLDTTASCPANGSARRSACTGRGSSWRRRSLLLPTGSSLRGLEDKDRRRREADDD